jgi:hypothetical protein
MKITNNIYKQWYLVLTGIPKIEKLEIEGRGFHTNLYAVRGAYSGGREGKSKIQWLRSMIGSPDLISIPGMINFVKENYQLVPCFNNIVIPPNGAQSTILLNWYFDTISYLRSTSCAGEIGRMYEANVDDVGYRLVAIYTPVREDGVEGRPVSASTEPIAVGIVKLPTAILRVHFC